MIRCGLHAYTFKLADGNGVNCPGYRIAVYEVMRDGSRLLGRRVEVGDWARGDHVLVRPLRTARLSGQIPVDVPTIRTECAT